MAELRAAIEFGPADRREGSWTRLQLIAMKRLQLIAMNERFAGALRRTHPDPHEWTEPASRWSRGER